MKRAAMAVPGLFASRRGGRKAGFTLIELLITVAVIGIISAMAIPTVSAYRDECCVKAVIYEIAGMINEAKQNALVNEKYYAIGFNTADGRVSLLSGRGPDGKWNTADDEVVRSFRLADKGGGLCFGTGGHGAIDNDHADPPDGIAVPPNCNNSFIFDPELSGNCGTVYIMSASGAAMALSVNNKDFGYKMYRWGGKKWVRI